MFVYVSSGACGRWRHWISVGVVTVLGTDGSWGLGFSEGTAHSLNC